MKSDSSAHANADAFLEESAEDSGSCKASAELANEEHPGRRSLHVRIIFWLCVSQLAISVFVFDVFATRVSGALSADLRILLPVCQLLIGALCLLAFRKLTSRRDWALVAVLHLVLVINYWLIATGVHRVTMALALEAGLRLTIVGGWSLCFFGLAALVHIILNRRNRNRRAAGILKAAFAVAIVLVPLELTAAFLESRTHAPLPLTVDLPKSPDVHIATVGGSTMLGFPYDPQYGIGRVVAWQLQRQFPEKKFVLDNVALTGINLEGAIARLRMCSAFPDVLILYSGHNEFFHNTEDLALARRTHWRGVDDVMRCSPLFRILHRYLAQYAVVLVPEVQESSICGEQICPQYVLQERVNDYADHMRRLFLWAKANQVQVIYCVPASGDTNLGPNVSYCQDAVAERDVAERWTSIRKLRSAGRIDDALMEAKASVKAYPGFAEFHFLLGQCLREVGKTKEAMGQFILARDHDQLPLRCLSQWQQAGIDVATEFGIPVVQSEQILRQTSGDGVLDERQFLDGVHPNLRATFAIANAVSNAVVEARCIHATQSETPLGTFEESLEAMDVGVEVLLRAYSETQSVLEHYAKFRAFDQAGRLEQAAKWAERHRLLRSKEIVPGEAGTEKLPAR